MKDCEEETIAMHMSRVIALGTLIAAPAVYFAQDGSYNALVGSLSTIYRTSNAKTFTINP